MHSTVYVIGVKVFFLHFLATGGKAKWSSGDVRKNKNKTKFYRIIFFQKWIQGIK